MDLERLLKEHVVKLYSKEKLVERLSEIFRQEYCKLLACRSFAAVARSRRSAVIDELVGMINENIRAHEKIAKGFNGGFP